MTGTVSRDDLDWMEDGLCRQTDPEAFFPEKGNPSVRAVKRVCMRCRVWVECLDYALENGERFGVWGGKSERERRAIKLSRAKAAPIGSEVAA